MTEHYNGENQRRKFVWSDVQFSGKDVIQLIVVLLSFAMTWFSLAGKVEILGQQFSDFKDSALKWEESVNKRVDRIENKVDEFNNYKRDK